ncbi:single-stranded DNA-binding protein [Actinotalea sp.]|uniref:single-stranded DNA-binding protein n=1 Tax=Actinotalea sp. TaxID=1872145 RepID=UPI003561A009
MSGSTMMVTVVGWAATTPREVVGDGVPFTSFRLASTPRHFDARARTWVDGRTEWVTVKAFRDVAFNVAASVRKGDPLLVHGRLQTQEWQSEQGPRTDLVLEASALGHDLTRGTGRFARRVHVAGESGGDTARPSEEQPGARGPDPDGTPGQGPVSDSSLGPTVEGGDLEDDPWATPPADEEEDARVPTP